MFDLQTCARPNILALQPYRCARDDYKDDGTNILLDANENAYGPGLALEELGKQKEIQSSGLELEVDLQGLNRYPDPHQTELKQLLCDLRNAESQSPTPLRPDHLFIGVGSDEAIDNLIRCFCVPARDKILTCPPTYGMYSVSACVNDVSIVKVPLQATNDFAPDVPAICAALAADPSIKLVYLCSPGNPTGTVIPKAAVDAILAHPSWNGVLIVDEAYVDFAAPGSSFAPAVPTHPNLVVMQTMSKAFGLAGLRIGAAFCAPEVANLLNSLKAPYNISAPTSALARAALTEKHLARSTALRDMIVKQRNRMVEELPKIEGVGRFRGGLNANFVLVEMLDGRGGKPSNEVALKVYERLAEDRGVVVRFRGKEAGCEGCLRITVGTEAEVSRFLKELRTVLGLILGHDSTRAADEEAREQDANAIVA
ncbi:histidinol phosphate aminotransferase [Eremomyces bilateralis CBS 781.70]|uniref:histidinol-phosphate transaminase n=1 Tax=Eremomyces bilateralis CBS 781.70 TaxID=1392243 RepID=A0A6G1FV83_9PEZI|nr:histidinol phosphate aminotransferase [Eremomyces bilateralis CBS 781.70]KAF1809673.1 histidinol phosphate aminotransferase [Eremomyces bilateralis CBS 781.70]